MNTSNGPFPRMNRTKLGPRPTRSSQHGPRPTRSSQPRLKPTVGKSDHALKVTAECRLMFHCPIPLNCRGGKWSGMNGHRRHHYFYYDYLGLFFFGDASIVINWPRNETGCYLSSSTVFASFIEMRLLCRSNAVSKSSRKKKAYNYFYNALFSSHRVCWCVRRGAKI